VSFVVYRLVLITWYFDGLCDLSVRLSFASLEELAHNWHTGKKERGSDERNASKRSGELWESALRERWLRSC